MTGEPKRTSNIDIYSFADIEMAFVTCIQTEVSHIIFKFGRSVIRLCFAFFFICKVRMVQVESQFQANSVFVCYEVAEL